MLVSMIFTLANVIVVNRCFKEVEKALEKSVHLQSLMLFAQGGVRAKVIVATQIVAMLFTKERSARKGMMEKEVSDQFPTNLEATLKRWWCLMITSLMVAVGVGSVFFLATEL
ncbi:hypothetical protein [Pseudomonas sp. NPDC007930]|uniref:hypothetical protein n=1 Tax=Pseudomonas sp. NPDC007930 TaxID=3364417 RepID=UPI0036E415DE